MAMIDWVDRRLHNWARWARGGNAGGLGYATVNLMAVSSGASSGAVIPTNACEASETHDEVMKLPSELRATLEMYYMVSEGRAQLAVRLCCAVATVDARLTRAHRLLADAFDTKARAHQALHDEMVRQTLAARPH
jgi:DNA-directed RNA polymerase specialized sigma24 family protein